MRGFLLIVMSCCITHLIVPPVAASRAARKLSDSKGKTASGVEQPSSPSGGSAYSPRFVKYPVCDLTAPHLMLGLPAVGSEHSPSRQAVWTTYYSRVVVAEHQPLEVSIVKLYCASMAARKMLYHIDPERYFLFGDLVEEMSKLSKKDEAEAGEKLKSSIAAGNEVEVMLLHPDIFDRSVVKALLTLGWQEMKFYETERPVWHEWIEDELLEREAWILHMDREIERVDAEIEQTAHDHLQAQMADRMGREKQKKEGKSPQYGAVKAEEAVKGGVKKAVFRRRLNVVEKAQTLIGRLEMERMQLEGAREEMEKVNRRWMERRETVMIEWGRFLKGAETRLERNGANEGGESWEAGLEWISRTYAENPEENREMCEGYMMEMVLEVNNVKRISGNAWKHDAKKEASLAELLGLLAAEAEKEEVEEEGIGNSGASSFDWLVDEMLQDVQDLDIDVDEVLDQLIDMNQQSLFNDILAATGEPEQAQKALAGLMKGVNEIVEEMMSAVEAKNDGEQITNLGQLASVLMGVDREDPVGTPKATMKALAAGKTDEDGGVLTSVM